ncbi:hypothetical protein NE850_24690 [Paraburkholderia sp. USG1]|uniref:hypothetical protein n=1 Tax=Paraburkholderia sp. USG1 TaxID=2952268 RepID=UPI002866D26A|nr:hypothetical protein [Paraburkholderia sp. USG1]MDR8399512.1 hypothetical protein [Paraburkholderia sp. USG1]
MLLRWLIHTLCMTPAELRLVLEGVRAYHQYSQQSLHERDPQWRFDRRITRNVRLSLLTGLLIVHIDSPHVFAAGLIALPLAVLIALLRLIGTLR